MQGGKQSSAIWRVSLARIEQVVSAHLGSGRISGNAAGPCFSRQISMYFGEAPRPLELVADRKVLQ
jgi:hypothetical protein